MKKHLLFTALLLLSNLLSAQIIESVSFSLSDFSFDSVGNYVRITHVEQTYTEVVGSPELPRIEIKYVIPFDSYVSGISVTDSTVQMIHGTYSIYPKQPDICIGDPTPSFVFDSAAYRNDQPYTGKCIEVYDQYYEMGFHVATINVYPYSYIPLQQRLFFYSSINFSLQLSPYDIGLSRPTMVSRPMYELSKTLIKSQVKNSSDVDMVSMGPLRIVEMNEQVPDLIPIMQTQTGALPQYLIITNDRDVNGNLIEPYQGKHMTDYFQEFADWKTKKGVPAVIVTVDDICNNYTGNDKQTKIHNFLADVYEQYGMMNVLLGGDVNVVPERIVDTAYLVEGSNPVISPPYPSDYYYNAIGSSWDSNGNGIYGETTPGPQDYIYYNTHFELGRIPVKDCVDASVFLNKDTTYEKMSGVSVRSYINNLAFMVGDLKDNVNIYNRQTHDYIDKHIGLQEICYSNGQPIDTTIYGITQENIISWRLFEDNYSFDYIVRDASSSNYTTLHSIGWEEHSMMLGHNNVFALLKDGVPFTMQHERPHILYHIDHSSHLNMGTSTKRHNESINRGNVDLLDNAPYYQILLSQGCSPGAYQKDCIVEHFLNNPTGGAVAVFASSTTSLLSEMQSFCQFISPLYYQTTPLGVPFPSSLYHLGQIQNNYNTNKKNKIKNHLFGDPELPIWTREPVDLTVSTSPSTITNQNNQLSVSVSGMAYSEYATNDVMVCVMKEGEVYLREAYNGTAHSHDFVFDVNPETAGELKVTVTGHNYIPYETTVPVAITGKNVYVSQKAVQDASGNNDGRLDAGETVHLGITLKNNGTVALTNVSAVLSCEFADTTLNQNPGSYLTLTTASASYGNIAKNAAVTRNNFQLTLSDTVPDRSALRCTLTVSDGSGPIGSKTFTLPIGAPEMEYVSVRYEEKGNGRIGLEIELTNTGFGTAKGVTATLASQDVQVLPETALYGVVSHLESKTRSFEFIPADSFNGSSFLLTVTDAYGKTWPFGFDLNILLDTVANLAFESTEHSIKLRWDPVIGSNGYNVYRSVTWDGDYERLNNHPFTSSSYPDLGLEALQTYYYGVTYLDGSGNESPMARIAAWTSLPLASGWPVSISDNLGRPWGTAPNTADIDGDGRQEIFLTTGTGDDPGDQGAILGLDCLGAELYDIDHNPTTVSGFANLGVSMTCTPAIGDIDGDGIMEVVVATRSDVADTIHKLCVYKNRDADQDGAPDLFWERPLKYRNFNGVVLADLDGDGTLEIIAPNQGGNSRSRQTILDVFDCYGGFYSADSTIMVSDPQNTDCKAVTMPVAADLDLDGEKEIVFGLESGVYKWKGSRNQLTCLTPNQPGRMDCPVVAADIDGDGTLEVLYMAIFDKKGYVKAVEADSTPVSAWSGNTHGITLTGDDHDYEWPPYFCVADLDNDGGIEVFAADKDTLKMWNGDGTPFGMGTVVVNGLDCRYTQPLVADVDGGGDCEIVVPSQNGKIHAFKPDGSAVPGWPLAVADLSTIPAVTDLDGDGLNEVVAASKTEVYMWHTEGESRYNGWDRFRYDRCNNAVYELPCTHSGTPLGISDTLVWTEDRRLNRDVIVNGGALLTVKSKLEFSGGSKVVVRPGGRLVVDGGRLTGSCPDAMWKGIEVWGDSTAHQQQVDGRYLQGYLELREGAVIENALCAVNLQDPLDDATTGGVVHATGALFRNNATAVHAGPYRCLDEVSGAELAYNAWFRDCTFSAGAGYLADTVFHSHALLEGVRGVKFSGCAFSADRDVSGVSSLCYGIDAYDASLLVNTYCDALIRPCPTEDLVRSSFSGFHQGIHAVGDGQREAIPMVYDADFSGNDIGVLCRATGFATLVGNSFTLGNDADCAIGLYADGVTGLIAEDNAFQTVPYSDVITYGAVVEDSRAANDVYLNSFSGLDYGNLSIGQNAVVDYSGGTPSATTGLTYTCNTNTGNRVDFYIADKTGEYSGIQPSQGSLRVPAGNTFSGSQYHIYNGGDYTLQYFHNSLATGQTPSSSKLHGVTATGVLRDHPCASHYGGQPRGGSSEELAALEADFVEADSSYAALRRIYESRLDGGDTRAATAAVVAAHADDAPALKARLMALSPYLSQQVLLAAARRSDILSPGDLFDVLWANPDELGRDTLVRQIEGLGVLEDGMAELLRGRAGAFTERTALEAETASAAHGRTLALGDMARCLLSDTAVDNAAVRGLLLRFGAPDTDRLAVTSLMEEGDTEGALALAGTLPDRYGLEGADLEEHGDYMRLLGLYRDLRRTGRTVGELTPEELSMAEKIAGQGRGASRTMAETLLERGFGGHNASFCPPDYATVNRDGTEGKGTGTDAIPRGLGASDGMTVTVSPSPATATATVAYTLPEKATHATLELANTLGVKVLSAELNGNSGSMTLDLGRLAGGVYCYTVRCGELVETGKLVVVK